MHISRFEKNTFSADDSDMPIFEDWDGVILPGEGRDEAAIKHAEMVCAKINEVFDKNDKELAAIFGVQSDS
ncbi:MAG: hypothetical protein LBH36_01740 [Candidatus Nomurabacteria bacterium]|jgi:hypothetical protein|nr:hypothetical protein [Candidatus Nomurabacteria bacterium]